MATSDGSAKAPVGAPQAPTVLNSYTPRPVSAWARIDVDVTMPTLPLAATKKVGGIPEWTLAASGLFTVNDPADDAIIDYKFLDSMQAPNGGHFLDNSVEQTPGMVIDVPTSTLGGVSGTVLDALQAPSFHEGGGSAGVAATSLVHTAPTVTVADGAPSFTATTSVGGGSVVVPVSSVAEPVANGAMVISGGATLELASPYSGTVSFAAATGTLIIDNSSSFSGTIAGQLAIGDVIDLADITAGANATITYSGKDSSGTLTVSDGTHTANIALEGNYSLANFTAYSDGHGGTSVIDPPTYVGTGLDANGWTTFTPSADTHIIYVSSGTGSDSNNGLSPNTAVASIAKGLSLIRDGSADWLLLKAGDTWVNQEIGYIGFSGRSATEPILISSYGTGARPLIETGPNGSGAAIGGIQTNHDNVAIVGLDFYAYTRDPSNPNFAGPGPDQYGIRFVSPENNLLLEDCKFSFYTANTIEGSGSGNVILRRDIIVDNYSTTSLHSEGLYVDNVANLVLEQNIFDHNGWNSSVSGADPNIFNHDLYIQTTSGPATLIGNIFGDASSHGAQVRPGGTVLDNLFVRDPIGLLIGGSASTVSGNVFLEGNDIGGGARGWGIDVNPSSGPIQVLNNIIAHEASTGNNGHGINFATGDVNDIAQNNIIYQWDNPIIDSGSVDITMPNAINLTGYLDPNRSIETYMASLGGSATLAAFIAAARNQSKSDWNPQYTAEAVNSYIASGFVNSGSVPPAPPPPPTSSNLVVPTSSNLVVNGGFETGDFTGWTASGNVAQLSIGPQLFITSSAHSGQDAAGFGSVGSDGTISQNLTTVVGQSYTLDFWLANTAGGPNDFTAKIGGVTELHLVNAAAQPYTHYDFTFTATSTSTPLEFDFRQDPLEWHLDDVSVVQTTGSASVVQTIDSASTVQTTGSAAPPPPPTPSAGPVISSFSPDTTPVGDGHTTATSITLTGTGEANSTVNVFDGTTSVGHASVNASGDWSLPASGPTVGPHSFTATDTDANGTSAASAVYAVTVDAPTAPHGHGVHGAHTPLHLNDLFFA
jgi:hypothetical protein